MTVKAAAGTIRPDCVVESRLHPRRTDRRAQAKLIQEWHRGEERFVGRDPGHAGLGIYDVLDVVTERTVLIGARGDREVEPVTQRDMLLDVRADRAIIGIRCGDRRRSGRSLSRILRTGTKTYVGGLRAA